MPYNGLYVADTEQCKICTFRMEAPQWTAGKMEDEGCTVWLGLIRSKHSSKPGPAAPITVMSHDKAWLVAGRSAGAGLQITLRQQ